MAAIKRVLVIGATSQIGNYLVPQLLSAGMEVHGLTRKAPANPTEGGITWHEGDASAVCPIGRDYDAIIHIAFLDLLPVFLKNHEPFPALTRVIGFSSTSRFTKETSGDEKERATAQGLIQAEAAVNDWCALNHAAWTILRPTLIYGRGKDGNVSTIARFIRRFPVFPLIGGGKALRQPVHAEDLANAVFLALSAPAACNRAYNVSGGETLSYRQMVARVYNAMGKRPRFVTIPLPLLKLLLKAVRLFPGYRHITLEMATRMQGDLCFSHEEATRDFGYAPGPFRPEVV